MNSFAYCSFKSSLSVWEVCWGNHSSDSPLKRKIFVKKTGVITRQEAVSMIPPMFLDIQVNFYWKSIEIIIKNKTCLKN